MSGSGSSWGKSFRYLIGRPTTEDVVLDQKEQLAVLEEIILSETNMVAQCKANALRLHKAKQVAGARQATAAMKEHQKSLDQASGKMTVLLSQMNQVKSMDGNVKMVDTIGQANKVMKRMGSKVTVDNVDTVMADAMELKQEHVEVSDMLSGKGFELDVVDPDDVDAELAAMAAEAEAEGDVDVLNFSPAARMNPRAPIASAAERERYQSEEARREAEVLEKLQRMPAAPTAKSYAATRQHQLYSYDPNAEELEDELLNPPPRNNGKF